MCGIVAVVAKRKALPVLLAGLNALAYRGYDSTGVALIDNNKSDKLVLIKAEGKLENLVKKLGDIEIYNQTVGIGHTRWATHGKPSEENAHPHIAKDKIAIVHNGIIENYLELKSDLLELSKKHNLDYRFKSDTDSEVISFWVYHKVYFEKISMFDALNLAKEVFKGHYAFVATDLSNDELFGLQCGSPLVIGLGVGEYFISSDSVAFNNLTNSCIYCEVGDIAIISIKYGIKIYDKSGAIVKRDVCSINSSNLDLDQDLGGHEKGSYKHFMLKEIMSQDIACTKTHENLHKEFIPKIFDNKKLKEVKSVHIVACGTSYYAGCVSRYWFESLSNLPCSVEIASEYRYRDVAVADGTLLILISQSGETADTLAVLRDAKSSGKNYLGVLSICNVARSTLVRESDWVCLTSAGAEYGVASTKAFTTQLVALWCLSEGLSDSHSSSLRGGDSHCCNLLPENIKPPISQILKKADTIKQVASLFHEYEHMLFLGRGQLYPIAQEGALKLKEISYIHAEAYAAGELKHGPLALVDSKMPVVVLVDKNDMPEKICANIQEVQARGGRVIIFTNDTNLSKKISLNKTDFIIDISADINSDISSELISVDNIISQASINSKNTGLTPIVFVIALQLFAYYIADFKGTDIDQPRNLAKSVTVE
jgi:glutamine---fructose-6-phosphate transaminase (isomerizing)